MTNYAAMAKRIRACRTNSDFDLIDKSLTRVYTAGAITANELQRLDCLIIDCKHALDYHLGVDQM